MPKASSRRASNTIDHKLIIATSLQEASTWLHQAEVALHDHPQESDHEPKDLEMLRKMQRNITRIHNRYSRIKMG